MKKIILISICVLFLGCTDQKYVVFKQGVKSLYSPIHLDYTKQLKDRVDREEIDQETYKIRADTEKQLNDFINKPESTTKPFGF